MKLRKSVIWRRVACILAILILGLSLSLAVACSGGGTGNLGETGDAGGAYGTSGAGGETDGANDASGKPDAAAKLSEGKDLSSAWFSGSTSGSDGAASNGGSQDTNATQGTRLPSPAEFSTPAYAGSPYARVNGNVPYFDAELITRAERGSFEEYASLDDLGRATCALACAGPDTLPEGERGSIGNIRPSGFHLTRYDWVDGKYLYNRCHLIGWQITGENDNVRNLVTGTRHMNVEGMLPFEEQVADYIESTGNHVLYRATAVYEGEDLVCRGVLLEAQSVEDGGAGLRFCVFCFNVQPGVSITYATGASVADGTMSEEDLVDESQFAYILNTNTKKIHEPDCPSVADMKEKNKRGFNGTVAEAQAQGYSPCGRCKP